MCVLIGTSGWAYKHWNEKFFPPEIKGTAQLPYYSERFPTVEINSSFYRMPTAEIFKTWHQNSNNEFCFSVKLNRYLTHRKRLIIDKESRNYLKAFLSNSQELKEKFGALLIQLPPSSKLNLVRLSKFFETFFKSLDRYKYQPDVAIEFRHKSWFTEEIYSLLTLYRVALVIANSSRYPTVEKFTAPFSYIRLHGPGALFSSKYPKKNLDRWAKFVKQNKDVKRFYIYFNNDFGAYAIDNALYLKKKIKG